jgi:hypothetical protein
MQNPTNLGLQLNALINIFFEKALLRHKPKRELQREALQRSFGFLLCV